MIRISAKGPAKNVKRAAARHGVALRNLTARPRWSAKPGGEVISAETSCANYARLIHWRWDKSYRPGPGDRRSSRPSMPGTLFSINARDCNIDPNLLLDGARSGRRRRRQR